MVKISKTLKFVLFADDTNIIYSGYNMKEILEQITAEMNKLKNWFHINKLSLNLQKTKLMFFGQKRNTIPVQVIIDNISIERVHQNVFLGVVIDEKISWKPHISYLRTKVAKCVGIMKRASPALNHKALLILYRSLVMPYLNYCSEVWGNCSRTNLQPLVVLQKRAIRVVNGARYCDHTNPLFSKTFDLKLFDLVDFKTAQIMFRAFRNCLPENIQKLFQHRDQHHTHDLRGRNLLYQPKVRTTAKSFCISVQGVKLWNGLSEDQRSCMNIYQFNREFKRNVIVTYCN